MLRTLAAVFVAALLPTHLAAQGSGPVTVEIWYGPMCSHCMFFLSQMLPAMFEAHLPGDQVRLTLLPYVLNDQGSMLDANQCEADATEPCHFLPAPLCALQAVPQPSPVDSADMYNAYQFMICDLAHANAGSPVPQTPASIEACASNAKVANQPWRDCVAQKTRSSVFEQKQQEVYQRLQQMQGLMAPFIFINGEALNCNDPHQCTLRNAAPGVVTGSLTQVVCSMIGGNYPGCLHPLKKYEARLLGRLPSLEVHSIPLLACFALACMAVVRMTSMVRRRVDDSGRAVVADVELYSPCISQAPSTSWRAPVQVDHTTA